MKANFFEEMSPAIEWNELARKICKRNEEFKLNNQQVLDEIDESEEDYDEGTSEQSSESDTSESSDDTAPEKKKEEVTKKPVASTKAPKEKSTAKPKSTTSAPPSIVDSNNENDESEADDDYDYGNDDDEDREDESILPVETNKIDKSKSILLDGIKVIKDFDDRIFGKFCYYVPIQPPSFVVIFLGGSDENDDESEGVLIQEASTNYRFIWPMLIVMLSIVVVLLIIMNVIALCMRKRGERYRQALLQSKNSIIYQKLSEEITPQTPKIHRYVITPEKVTPQTPKAHRYTPIEQV